MNEYLRILLVYFWEHLFFNTKRANMTRTMSQERGLRSCLHIYPSKGSRWKTLTENSQERTTKNSSFHEKMSSKERLQKPLMFEMDAWSEDSVQHWLLFLSQENSSWGKKRGGHRKEKKTNCSFFPSLNSRAGFWGWMNLSWRRWPWMNVVSEKL